jgi:glycosyltransferase involved in cell wall biosynthesis
VRVTLDVTAVPANPAGAGRYILELATALARRHDLGVELALICRSGDAARWEPLAPVHALSPRPRPLRLAWEQVRLPSALRRLGAEVHHSPHYTMPEAARLPRVVTVHDVSFFDHPEWHERSKVVLFRRAVRVASRHADAIVCVSQATADRLVVTCCPTVPVHVVTHGVDLRRFCPTEPSPGDDERALAPLDIRPPYVAFVGTIEPRKDIPTLVRAFDRMAEAHPELTLVLAGGDGWGLEPVEQALAVSRHRRRVLRPGYVPDEIVPALLRRAAAVAYPSLEEGFGLPALEALACGAPLVTTTGSAMQEVAAGAALLIAPGDADGLAAALDMLVRGDHAGAERRARGLAVAARHTWDACAEGHAAVYRAVHAAAAAAAPSA